MVDAKAPGWLRQISQHVAEASKEGGFLGIGGVSVSEVEKATLTEISMGDLPGRKRQPDQAVIDLFRDYGGGQAGREGCPQGAVEQALRLIRGGRLRQIRIQQAAAFVREMKLEHSGGSSSGTTPVARASLP